MVPKYAELGETLYFHFAVNDTSGSANNGSSPACDVRECGDTISDAPTYSPTPARCSHVNYGAGKYEVAIAATTGNGFTAEKEYAVFADITADGQTPGALIGTFYLSKTNPGFGNVLLSTTVATVAGNGSFTLTNGASKNDVYNNRMCVARDTTSATTDEEVMVGFIKDYVGASLDVTLKRAMVGFTLAVGDKIEIVAVDSHLESVNQVQLEGDGDSTPMNPV